MLHRLRSGKSSGSGRVSRARDIPVPTEGWDTETPIAQMSSLRAYVMDNWWPEPGYIEPRNGYGLHADTEETNPVESLLVWNGPTAAIKMFAACGGSIWETTTSTVSEDITGLSNDRWQSVNIATTGGNFLWICNGADAPRYYDGTSWATTSITGITSTDIIYACLHKQRIWMVLKNSLVAAYLGLDSIDGAGTAFDLTAVFQKGGYLQAISTWTLDGGNGPDDYIAFITSRGEVAIYSGVTPATDYTLVGVFEVGIPIGRRCVTEIGGDIAILTQSGVVSLSQTMVQDRAAQSRSALTKNIQSAINDAAALYSANFGWEMISYPKRTMFLVNTPAGTNADQYQFAMNVKHGAWCRFIGQEANCWALVGDDLYFGGNLGKVYQADVAAADYESYIETDLMCAFNYFGSRTSQKRFIMSRALITTDGTLTPNLGMNTDFRKNVDVTAAVTSPETRAMWDIAVWDIDVWANETIYVNDWINTPGIGYCGSLRMRTRTDYVAEQSPIILQVNGFTVVMEDGAIV